MSEEKVSSDKTMEDKKETKKSELEVCKEKMEEYLNGWKRAKADYSNQKKDFEKKEKEIVQFANATLILEIMPIYDNFKLAWKHIPEDHKKNDDWLKGIEAIKKQFTELLKKLGLEEIPTEGEKFDPEIHEAVAKEKAEGKESGIILEEMKAGYKLYDKVLEPAKVKVAE
ncbi:MAG: nucleotide exchange factor GrpE [bacterium]|nr:nucleotide exchange factor GrpE [bacterium]